MLLVKEETTLKGMIDTLTEIGRCYGMEINVGKTKIMRISRETSLLHIMIDKKRLTNAEYFNYLGSMTTDDARCTREIKSRSVMAKASFSNKLDLHLRMILKKCYIWSIALNCAETWKRSRIIWNVSKCSARVGFRRSVGPIV